MPRIEYPGDPHFIGEANRAHGATVPAGIVQSLPPYQGMISLLHQANNIEDHRAWAIPQIAEAAFAKARILAVAADAAKAIANHFAAELKLESPFPVPATATPGDADGHPDHCDAAQVEGGPGSGTPGADGGGPAAGRSRDRGRDRARQERPDGDAPQGAGGSADPRRRPA